MLNALRSMHTLHLSILHFSIKRSPKARATRFVLIRSQLSAN